MIRIIVCMKQVLDPEAPSSAYKVDSEANRVVIKGVPPVLSPFDENALEAALRIKDAHKSRITVVSAGQNLSKAVLMKALAVGVDELFLLEDSAFAEMDGYDTALVLASAIKKLGNFDLILTGRQAADTNAGVVGLGVAEILGISSVTIARKIEFEGSKVVVERLVSDGYEIVETPLPSLITVSSELGELRYPKMQDLVAARKKPITTWDSQKLGIATSLKKRAKLQRLYIPQKESRCELVGGTEPKEAGANLAIKLREGKIL
jgi:electron transfer flavoprotein beta subunit